jgi:hypothetical protein
LIPCGPDPYRCDDSFCCPAHEEEIEKERLLQRQEDDSKLLRRIDDRLSVIEEVLKPFLDEKKRLAFVKAITEPL